MQAQILGAIIELTPLDEKHGVYACDLSMLGFGRDCVVKRQRVRAQSKELFKTPGGGMSPVVDYWLLQYCLADATDRVQRQLAPSALEDTASSTGQTMPMFVATGWGRNADLMLFKGARYCTRADYLEGKRVAQANLAAWANSRTRNSALNQLASEVAHGVSTAIPAAVAAHMQGKNQNKGG